MGATSPSATWRGAGADPNGRLKWADCCAASVDGRRGGGGDMSGQYGIDDLPDITASALSITAVVYGATFL
jgi:hypothetical protein